MKLVFQTQVRENYGSEDQPRWKNKGGTVYVVENLTERQAQRGHENHPVLASLIEHANSMFEEYITGCAVLDDNDAVCEPWDSPICFTYVGGQWHASQTVTNDEYGYMHPDVARADKTWIPMHGGDRTNYQVVYTLRDGRVAQGEQAAMNMLRAA